MPSNEESLAKAAPEIPAVSLNTLRQAVPVTRQALRESGDKVTNSPVSAVLMAPQNA
jgi:hypothetical protein